MKCIHHWLIDARDIGRCQKCGQVRDFCRLMTKEHEKNTTGLRPNPLAKRWKRGRKPKKK